MKVIQKSNTRGTGKEIGEAYIEISQDRSEAYLQAIDNTTGKVIRFIKFENISNGGTTIDLSLLQGVLNNIASAIDSCDGGYRPSVSITSRGTNTNYAVTNTN